MIIFVLVVRKMPQYHTIIATYVQRPCFFSFKFIVGLHASTVNVLSQLPFLRPCLAICVVFKYFDGR